MKQSKKVILDCLRYFTQAQANIGAYFGMDAQDSLSVARFFCLLNTTNKFEYEI